MALLAGTTFGSALGRGANPGPTTRRRKFVRLQTGKNAATGNAQAA